MSSPQNPDPLPAGEAPRVLVVRLSSLGDIVLTAPVYKNIKAHWPDAHVCVLVKEPFVPLLERNPHVDEILPYRGLRRTLSEIRRRSFTHLLDLHANLRSFWLRHLAAVPHVSVYRKDALARRLFVLFGRFSPALTRHTLDRYLEALNPWGVPVAHRDLSLGDYGAARQAPQKARRVLLVQTSFLGDVLLSVPLARKIKELLGDCRLSVLTRPQTADVFRACPAVDQVLEYDKRGADAGLLGLWRAAKRLRGEGFELCLVAHRSLRSALLAYLARIPRRIGFSSSAGWFLYHRTVFFSWGMPDLERNLALLLPLAPDVAVDGSDALYLTRRAARGGPDAAESIRRRLEAAGALEGPLVGLHPGSAWPTKRWLPERYALLARRLTREAGCRVVLIGGKEDHGLCEAIAQDADARVLSWAGETSLPELIELMRRLHLLVTNDSGPMHIAAASGVPTLALFGPTTRELGFFPYGEGHRVLERELPCRPCGLHGSRACPQGHFLCMRLILVSEVYREALAMMKAPSEAGASTETSSPAAPPP